jgi:pantetheine-phosphate adenylyltransferase
MPPPDNRTAICPGTFDPVTYGHLDVISRASAMYDSVVVGVVNVPWRKGSTLFTVEERMAFVNNAVKGLDNVTVEPFSTLLVEFARARGAMAIVKGLRAISDFEYELEMDQLNRRQAPEIESVYLMASGKYSFLRSSGVKELATFGGDIDDLVPQEVAKALKERLGR